MIILQVSALDTSSIGGHLLVNNQHLVYNYATYTQCNLQWGCMETGILICAIAQLVGGPIVWVEWITSGSKINVNINVNFIAFGETMRDVKCVINWVDQKLSMEETGTYISASQFVPLQELEQEQEWIGKDHYIKIHVQLTVILVNQPCSMYCIIGLS